MADGDAAGRHSPPAPAIPASTSTGVLKPRGGAPSKINSGMPRHSDGRQAMCFPGPTGISLITRRLPSSRGRDRTAATPAAGRAGSTRRARPRLGVPTILDTPLGRMRPCPSSGGSARRPRLKPSLRRRVDPFCARGLHGCLVRDFGVGDCAGRGVGARSLASYDVPAGFSVQQRQQGRGVEDDRFPIESSSTAASRRRSAMSSSLRLTLSPAALSNCCQARSRVSRRRWAPSR